MEHCILALAQYHHYYHHTAPSDTFVSDGSTITITPTLSNTNFAIFANGNAFATSISSHGSKTGILHGKCYGIIATSLLALHSKLPQTTLYSDHLSSVTFLTLTPQPHILTTKPVHSYYHWILNIWNNAQNNNQHISLLHCKAHTTNNTLPANMNQLADHITSHSHHDPSPSLTTTSSNFCYR